MPLLNLGVQVAVGVITPLVNTTLNTAGQARIPGKEGSDCVTQ